MDTLALVFFILIYIGMALGSWPGLALDRTGIALLGAIAFIELQDIPLAGICNYIDVPALSILFSFMMISAQFFYSGFYTRVISWMGSRNLSPPQLLLAVIFVSAFLSAALINDIVCLALAPLTIKVCKGKKLDPIPFLLGLASASNIGSALTLVGNPQNLLIGQVLGLSFTKYIQFALIPCLISLFGLWLLILFQTRGNWEKEADEIRKDNIDFDRWQSFKGIAVLATLLGVFFFTNIPRDKAALVAAGILLLSRKMASHKILSFIDWQLLVLFIGLFVVNKSFTDLYPADNMRAFLQSYQIDMAAPFWILAAALILSNLVSNVPAVMLLLPLIQSDMSGALLALSSTLAGNLFVIGSIANLIVISEAAKSGIKIDWKTHMRVGIPITLISMISVGLQSYFMLKGRFF